MRRRCRVFSLSNAAGVWYMTCSPEAERRLFMISGGRRKEKQRQYLRPGIAMFLATYFLNLCTLNPHVHAATLRQVSLSQQAQAGHCARPFVAPQAPESHPANHEQRTEPLCCELRGAQNKALLVAPLQIDASPLPLMVFIPPLGAMLTKGVPCLPVLQAVHSSHPPPLYLLHAALLI